MAATWCKFIDVLRWIIILPAASLAGWCVWIAVTVMGGLLLALAGTTHHSFLSQLYFSSAGYVSLGSAFVSMGVMAAPYYRKQVAYILAALIITWGSAMLYPDIMDGNRWSAWSLICIGFGTTMVIYFMSSIYSPD